jgi:hypothetical protein
MKQAFGTDFERVSPKALSKILSRMTSSYSQLDLLFRQQTVVMCKRKAQLNATARSNCFTVHAHTGKVLPRILT